MGAFPEVAVWASLLARKAKPELLPPKMPPLSLHGFLLLLLSTGPAFLHLTLNQSLRCPQPKTLDYTARAECRAGPTCTLQAEQGFATPRRLFGENRSPVHTAQG